MSGKIGDQCDARVSNLYGDRRANLQQKLCTDAQRATDACRRKCIEYWHGIGPVREIERAMEMKEASWWLMKRYSRISSVNLFFSFIPAALRIVRIEPAVRPCFPITLPRSLSATRNSKT